MAAKERNGVFISYATGDGAEFAEGLRAALTAHRIDVWQDVIKLRGGDNWWQQIVEAITRVKYVLMVLTPLALNRPTVQKEWRLARQEGVRVLPILASPDITLETLPRWMQKIQLYRLGFDPAQITSAKNWTLFINDIQTTYEPKRRPFMADDLGVYIQRSAEYDALIDLLLDTDRNEPKAITSALALKGAGGYGKTTLARAICHDERVQDAFDDGILWVTLGESATFDTVRTQIDSLITVLSGERFDAPTLEAAKTRLRELLDDRDLLMVIDDVWNADHARPFLEGGERVARLITTRMGESLPDGARKVAVNQMTGGEAFALLTYGLPADQVSVAHAELDTLTADLLEYPLPLKLANGILRDRVNEKHVTLTSAITYVNDLLEEFGLALNDRKSVVEAALRASLDQLDPQELEAFKRLAIFPDDLDIPLDALQLLWDARRTRAELTCERLENLSLLLRFDPAAQTIRLHDVTRDFLLRQAGSLLPRHGSREVFEAGIMDTAVSLPVEMYLKAGGSVIEWQREFLDRYRQPGFTMQTREGRQPISAWVELRDDEPYLWKWLAYHLIEAARGDELIITVLDLRYLAKKTHLKGTAAVEQDIHAAALYAQANTHPQQQALGLLERNYRNVAHLLRRCESMNEALATLNARLSHLEALQPSCQAAEPHLQPPYLAKVHNLPDLPHPSLVFTLTGHTEGVRDAAWSPDGRHIVSASDDGTLKVWDVQTGVEIRTLSGHKNGVNSAMWSPDGRQIVSASWDGTLKVWNAEVWTEICTLSGHRTWMTDATWSPNGQHIVSASQDGTLKVWDAEAGIEICTLTGHTEEVSSAAWSPNGRQIVSASHDNTLKVWDADTGTEVCTLRGHTEEVSSAAWSPNGRQIVSASHDNTLKVWDANTGTEVCTLRGHTDRVSSAVWSSDGERIVSASWDKTLKVWDTDTGTEVCTLKGHTDRVSSAAWLPYGKQIVSTSDDRTLKVWDTEIETDNWTLTSDWQVVNCVAWSPDGRQIVSVLWDNTLKVWDAELGTIARTLTGHTELVNSAAWSPNGTQIVSASWDKTLRVWDAETGTEIRTLTGYMNEVSSAAWSLNGKRIVSASHDSTLKVWDAELGTVVRTLTGHTEEVNSAAWSPNGRHIVITSNDNMLKMWDAETGTEIRTLAGHTGRVIKASWSPDGWHIVSASLDKTLKVWDAKAGGEVRTLTGHTDGVTDGAWSPDGQHIVSASDDRTLKVWDAATGECRATFYADAPLHCCAWSPDGQHIVAGGENGYIYWLRWVE